MDQAPRIEAVPAPLPDELRPYIVLHAENAHLPPGSRFGGHWVNAWRCRVPFVQIDRARSQEVARCVPFAGNGDPEAMRTLLRDAACLIAADETWLEQAAAAGTPTIYLADGHPDRAPLPTALQAFGPDRLRVLHSGTNFRRDLPLRAINEALEHFVPGVTGEDRSESSRCRDRLAPYLEGRIADLGHGGHKVHERAIGVDFFKYDEFDWIGDVRDLWFFEADSFDSVYSSHCLEDLWHPHQALAEWTRILRPGGHLSLFLPLRDFYPNVGTPGANPGHKDDYVPEDVEQFLRELGHVDIVHSERIERHNSFEVVARKRAGRSYFVQRDTRPRPQVSVLIVADPTDTPDVDASSLRATIASAQASLADTDHEVLVLDRDRRIGDARAGVHDMAARDARVHVVDDRQPQPYGRRFEALRRAAVGEHLLVLQPGTLLAPGAGDALHAAVAAGAPAAIPAASDPLGQALADDDAAASCLLLPASAWPANALVDSPYSTVALWRDLARKLAATPVPGARAITLGERGRPVAACGRARRLFDERIGTAGGDPMQVAPSRSILVVMLRTFGDCVLATPVLGALRRRHPDARIEVLTEQPYAWIFEQHDAVDAVRTADGLPANQFFLAEDRTVTTAIESGDYDRLVLLSDRVENITYHHSGHTLGDFYAIQAGVPEACGRPPELGLSLEVLAAWRQRRAQLGLDGPYAILHTRAGWPDKTPPPELFERIAAELAAAGRTPVVIGGPDERIDHPAVTNLAGQLSQAESAAAIAGAELFVGPDSGPLHVASGFGVRSLALYGGSHLRVAPPRAKGSCSVQAASCCPVPCGITPCPERNCGAAGLGIDAVLPRLEAVIDDRVSDHNEFWGHHRALCTASPDGPSLVSTTVQQFAGTPIAVQEAATAPNGVRSREVPAPVRPMPVELGLFALDQHAQLLRTFAPTIGNRDDTPEVLEALRCAVDPEHGFDVVCALMAQCRSLDAIRPVVQTIAAAISHCGAMMRGERGRPRAAYRLLAGDVLHRALHLPMPEPAGSTLRNQLFELFEKETGARPDREHVLSALAGTDDTRTEESVLASWQRLLRDSLGDIGAPHVTLMRHATMLRRSGDIAGAIGLLDRHLVELPPDALTETAEVRFLRGTFRLAMAELTGALEDVRFSAEHLDSDHDRQTALQIVARLEQHLAGIGAAR